MSIIVCQQDASVNDCEERIERDKIVLTYETSWFVASDDPAITMGDVLAAVDPVTGASIPNLGDNWQSPDGASIDPTVFCDSLRPSQVPDQPGIFMVRVQYSSDVLMDQITLNADDPLSKPTVITYATRARKRVIEADFFVDDAGNLLPQPIVNSAGEAYDPPMETDNYDLVITITKNVATFDAVQAWDSTGCCNQAAFTIDGVIFETYCLLIAEWSGEPAQDQNVSYYRQTFQVIARGPTEYQTSYANGAAWSEQKLNQGGQYFNAVTGLLQRVTDSQGNALNGKVMLRSDGRLLPNTALTNANNNPGTYTQTVGDASSIDVGDFLKIDGNDPTKSEVVTVTAVVSTPTTQSFTAVFVNAHRNGAPVTADQTYQTFYPYDRADFSAFNVL